jgi:peptidyl-prolyl cis-trans isomerase C
VACHPLIFFMRTLLALFLVTALCANASDSAQSSPRLTRDTVIVSNSKVKITKADFDAELQRIPESDRIEFLLSRSRMAGLVENILVNRILAQEAIDKKLDQLPEVKDEIQNQVEKVLAKHRGQQFMRDLETKDFTAAAREIYLTEPAKTTRPAKYRAWHTLVMTGTRDKVTAKARAQEARAKVLKGENLEAIAKEFSDDPSVSQKGGELDFVEAEKFDPAFAAVLKRMKPGDVSDVVETKFGFHVIYLLELLPEKRFTFDESKPLLLTEARNNYLSSVWESHLKRIREDSTIKLNTEALEELRPKIPENVKPVYVSPETIKAPPRNATK